MKKIVGLLLLCLGLHGADLLPLYAKIYPKIMAYDYDFPEKARDGKIQLGVVYREENRYDARRFLELLEERSPEVKEVPLEVRLLPEKEAGSGLAGYDGLVFLGAVDLSLVRKTAAKERGTLLFATLPEQLEAGAMVGLYVGKSVRPLLHKDSLRQAGVRFKPAFLKLARVYGEE